MTTPINVRNKVFILGAALLALSANGWAADSNSKPEHKEDCIQLTQIRDTKVIDDQNILVYAGPNRVYKNHLPHKCNGLRNADSYMYKTSLSQLCSLDVITILNRYGSAFSQGPSCGLGKFELIDRKTADELLKKARH